MWGDYVDKHRETYSGPHDAIPLDGEIVIFASKQRNKVGQVDL